VGAFIEAHRASFGGRADPQDSGPVSIRLLRMLSRQPRPGRRNLALVGCPITLPQAALGTMLRAPNLIALARNTERIMQAAWLQTRPANRTSVRI
jgi:hypothetical protein